MGQLLFKFRSNLNQGLESPSNWPGKVITCSNGIDTKYKEIRVDSSGNKLINYPYNGAISTGYDDSEIGLFLFSKFLDDLYLINFLLLIKQISKVNEGGAMRLVLELDLCEVMCKILLPFSIATLGVDKEEEVIVHVLFYSLWLLDHCVGYNSFL